MGTKKCGVAGAGRWLPLVPDIVTGVPARSGVFEVASLVRHLLYVGPGEGNLQARLLELSRVPGRQLPQSIGGYYFRYRVTDTEGDALNAVLAAYGRQHGGRIPPGNIPTGGAPAAPAMSPALQAA